LAVNSSVSPARMQAVAGEWTAEEGVLEPPKGNPAQPDRRESLN
jgi:hypothetical protein